MLSLPLARQGHCHSSFPDRIIDDCRIPLTSANGPFWMVLFAVSRSRRKDGFYCPQDRSTGSGCCEDSVGYPVDERAALDRGSLMVVQSLTATSLVIALP